MAMVFTCKKCDTRAAKSFSRHSYENGIVVVRCPGCQSMHLVADNLGWFEKGEQGFRIEDLLRSRGERVMRIKADHASGSDDGGDGGDGTAGQPLSAEDVAGWSKVQQLIQATAGSSGAAEGSSGAESAARRPHAAAQGGGGSPDLSGDGGVLSVSADDMDAWARVAASRDAGARGEGSGKG